MLRENQTLQYLDVSSNYLGKDYFSRQMGEALKVNTTLKTLRYVAAVNGLKSQCFYLSGV